MSPNVGQLALYDIGKKMLGRQYTKKEKYSFFFLIIFLFQFKSIRLVLPPT
jgi:hypothetical protein